MIDTGFALRSYIQIYFEKMREPDPQYAPNAPYLGIMPWKLEKQNLIAGNTFPKLSPTQGTSA